MFAFASTVYDAKALVAELVDATIFKIDACGGHAGSSPVERTVTSAKDTDMRQKDKLMLQKLEQERARLQRQIEALQNEVRGLERAIALCAPETVEKKERPKNVKGTVLKLLEDAGLVGMTAAEVVETALQRGIHLEKSTVASNLSRLKLDGQLDFRDGRYVFRAAAAPATGWGKPMVQ